MMPRSSKHFVSANRVALIAASIFPVGLMVRLLWVGPTGTSLRRVVCDPGGYWTTLRFMEGKTALQLKRFPTTTHEFNQLVSGDSRARIFRKVRGVDLLMSP